MSTPVLYIPFSEGNGNTVKDISGNNNNGMLSAPVWISGKFGNAVSFNGANNGTIPDSPSLKILSAITMMAWIKIPYNGGLTTPVITKYKGAGLGNYGLFVGPAVIAYLGGTIPIGGITDFYDGTINVMDDSWHHIAFTYDSAINSLGLYVDGLHDTPVNQASGPLLDTSSPVEIGSCLNFLPAPLYLVGSIGEIRIYDTWLSASEIDEIYHYRPPVPTPISYRTTKTRFDPVVEKYKRSLRGRSIAKALEETNH